MDLLQRRTQRVAQSLLENESLTADLDDAQAQVLLDWALERAETIVQRTAGLGEAEAEEELGPRLRALRRLLRRVNQWLSGGDDMDQRTSAETLAQIVGQAQVVSGPDYAPPPADQLRSLSRLRFELADDPSQMLARLLALIQPGSTEQEEPRGQA